MVGGTQSALPAGVSLSDLKEAVKKINENYQDGTADKGFLK